MISKLTEAKEEKGFTLVELLVVIAILLVLSIVLLPQVLGYSDKAREIKVKRDIRDIATATEVFSTMNGDYPEADLNSPKSIASILQKEDINWTGDNEGIVDPWGNPYYYDLTNDHYYIASAGKDGVFETNDDIFFNNGKIFKAACQLSENSIPSASSNPPSGNNVAGKYEGVPEGYIGIKYPHELLKIGSDPSYPLDGQYYVIANLDLSEYDNWLPIGASINADEPFTGIFDGNNYIISNLTINSNIYDLGLFGRAEGATFLNVRLENVNVTGGGNIAGLLGYGENITISDCSVTGAITRTRDNGGEAGALVGYLRQSVNISNCWSAGSVSGVGGTVGGLGGYIGGIIGSKITNCYSTCEVTGEWDTGGLNAGGLFGYISATEITNCYATGDVTGTGGSAGGLAGSINNGSANNCYATGDITGGNCTGGLTGKGSSCGINYCWYTGNVDGADDTGGLVGYYNNTNSKMKSCYANANVTGNKNVGGLVGHVVWSATITDCYGVGAVDASYSVGGLVGRLYYSSVINSSYAAVDVDGSTNVGGLVGYRSSSSTVNYSYYDETVSGCVDTGKGDPLTTNNMKLENSYSGWDFDAVWDIEEEVSYPYLQLNEQVPHPGI